MPLLDLRRAPRRGSRLRPRRPAPLPQLPLAVDCSRAGSSSPTARCQGSVGPVVSEHQDAGTTSSEPAVPRTPSGGSTTACRRRAHRAQGAASVFPEHWSFLLGEVALYAFAVPDPERHVPRALLLARHREPTRSTAALSAKLVGVKVTPAYRSALRPVLDRPGRSAHAPGAPLGGSDVFVAAMVLHLLRVFFTGAFRRRASSPGCSASSCSAPASSRASRATRCPTT